MQCLDPDPSRRLMDRSGRVVHSSGLCRAGRALVAAVCFRQLLGDADGDVPVGGFRDRQGMGARHVRHDEVQPPRPAAHPGEVEAPIGVAHPHGACRHRAAEAGRLRLREVTVRTPCDCPERHQRARRKRASLRPKLGRLRSGVGRMTAIRPSVPPRRRRERVTARGGRQVRRGSRRGRCGDRGASRGFSASRRGRRPPRRSGPAAAPSARRPQRARWAGGGGGSPA